MSTEAHFEFRGLDLRRDPGLSDVKTARVAKNVYLTSGRVWQARPGYKVAASLPSQTKGLYAGQGVLRTVAPAGYADIYNAQSPTVFFDFVGDGAAYDQDDIAEFINAERFGSSIAAGVQPYAVIRRASTGQLEQHWFRNRPAAPASAVDNKVDLPFVPSGMVLKVAEKLWTPDQVNGAVRFSSTQFGPADWTTTDDAGFLPVLANAPGDHTITGLAIMQSTGATDNRQAALVVFFEDAIQTWGVDPEPINHFLTGIVPGVGTKAFRSIANVLGFPVFLSRGGFADLRISHRVGALDTGLVGADIEPLTDALDPDDVTASVWWDAKGLYLCAVGSTVYAWKFDPLAKVRAWSVWELAHEVTDFVDFGDDLYFRASDDRVYKMADEFDTDDGAAINFDFETQHHHLGDPGGYKLFESLQVWQDGASTISYRPDPTDRTLEVPIYTADGVTRPHEKIPLVGMSDGVALRFTGQAPWKLSGYSVDYQMTGV